MLWGWHGWDRKKRTIIYIRAGSNLGFCLIQELVPDSGKEGARNLADGSSCVIYGRKPFSRSQGSKQWCFVYLSLLPNAGVDTATSCCDPWGCHLAQTNTRNGSFFPSSSAQLWTSSRYRNTRLRIIYVFTHIETYRDIYVLFKYEYTYIFTLAFCSAVAHAADLHLAQPAVTYWNSSSGDRFAQGFGRREQLLLAPPEPLCMGKGEQGRRLRHSAPPGWSQSGLESSSKSL